LHSLLPTLEDQTGFKARILVTQSLKQVKLFLSKTKKSKIWNRRVKDFKRRVFDKIQDQSLVCSSHVKISKRNTSNNEDQSQFIYRQTH